MKTIGLISLFSLLCCFSGLQAQRLYQEIIQKNPATPFKQIVEEVEKSYEGRDKGRGSGYKQFKRWEYFNERRLDEEGRYHNYSRRAFEEFFNYRAKKKNTEEQNYGCSWDEVGPTAYQRISSGHNGGIGRVGCIVQDPDDGDIMYVGTPAGGIWKTVNEGGTWDPTSNNKNWESLSDGLPAIGVSAIAIDPTSPAATRTIYILTGDGDSYDNPSIGVMKSFDGGISWYQTGLTWEIDDFNYGYKLKMHPTDPNTLFAATSIGIFRTTDGGINWTLEANGYFTDIEFRPGTPNTMYATSAGTLNFWRSTNGGDTWGVVTNGLTALSNRLEIAVTPDDPDVVYLVSGGVPSAGMFTGFYRSDDSGLNFNMQSNTPNILGYPDDGSDDRHQSFYDLAIVASPDDADMVMVGGINTWRSDDGGVNWTNMSSWNENGAAAGHYCHADIHALEYFGSTLYVGSDGGIYKSTNDGDDWTNISQGLQITQSYRIGAFSDGGDTYVMTGTQDNGLNQLRDDGSGWGPMEHWEGADGFEVSTDVANDVTYGATQNGDMMAYTYPNVGFTAIGQPEPGPWLTPHLYHDGLGLLVAGYKDVWTIIDSGNPWVNISNGQIDTFFCTHVAVADSDNDVIYVSKKLNMYRTIDGGSNWSDITAGLPTDDAHFITYFTIDPANANRVWVTLGGFVNRTSAGYTVGEKVFFTPDGGTTWQNISGTLPNLPANCIIYEAGSNDGVYVGMDVGVYYRDASMGDWVLFSNGLPNVIISELDINYTTGKIYAGTYGRGIWCSDLFEACGQVCLACPNYTGFHVSPNTFAADDCINSEAIVYDSTTITYQVDNLDGVGEIVLTDGFTAEGYKGAVFNALFRECNFGGPGSLIGNSNARKLSGFYVGEMPDEPTKSESTNSLAVDGNSRFKAFPNPTSGTVNLEVSLDNEAFVQIRLYDIFGQQLRTFEHGKFIEKGIHSFSYDLSQVPNGSYLLEVNVNGQSKVSNIVKAE